MYDYGRPRELHIEKSLEATKLVTRAGKVRRKCWRTAILIDAEYFRVERIHGAGGRSSESLRGAGEKGPVLSYLFAAAGAARFAGAGFDAVDLPARGLVAVPATSPSFKVEDVGGLDLIRITPNWPTGTK